MADLYASEYVPFEEMKHVDEFGIEYWFARDLRRLWSMKPGAGSKMR